MRRPNRGALSAATKARLSEGESRWQALRPWLLVRDEDAVLIAPPNHVFKLGGSALPLLRFLEAGGRLGDLPGSGGGPLDEARAAELIRFFDELEAAAEGRAPSGGFDRTAYDFDFSRLPILGELALTYHCNERCRFCYAGCGPRGADGEAGAAASARAIPAGPTRLDAAGLGEAELSTAEWKSIITLLKTDAKVPFFSFTGGEPLLRPDLEELAAHARELGLRVNLITNGSLATPARAASLRAAGIVSAQVSLESPDEGIHDELVGIDGAWRRTTAGIGALREAGISVQTNSTLTARNAESLIRLPLFLRELGVRRFSMNLFIPAGRGLGHEELFVPYSDCGEQIDAIRREAHWAGLTFFWYSPTPYCLYNPVARGLGNKSCAALDGLLHVNPRGEILPCSSWPEPIGNLLATPFAELWFSERTRRFKHKTFAPAACEGCDSFMACQGACPLYWRYTGEGELENKAHRAGFAQPSAGAPSISAATGSAPTAEAGVAPASSSTSHREEYSNG